MPVALVIVTVAPEPETVKLVAVVQFHEVALDEIVYVEAFKLSVRVLELFELKFAELTA